MVEDRADRRGVQETGLPSDCIRGVRKEEESGMTVESGLGGYGEFWNQWHWGFLVSQTQLPRAEESLMTN